jgi:hypothetical protein
MTMTKRVVISMMFSFGQLYDQSLQPQRWANLITAENAVPGYFFKASRTASLTPPTAF